MQLAHTCQTLRADFYVLTHFNQNWTSTDSLRLLKRYQRFSKTFFCPESITNISRATFPGEQFHLKAFNRLKKPYKNSIPTENDKLAFYTQRAGKMKCRSY